MRGQKGFNNVAENVSATKALLGNNKRMNTRPKMCWKCQKESPFQQGAYLNMKIGIHKYICKTCMDAKREAQAQKEQDQGQNP